MTNESELSQKLNTIKGLTLTSIHRGLEEKADSIRADGIGQKRAYLQDKWSVAISYNGQSHKADYFAGIGHRKLSSSVQKDSSGYYNKISGYFKNEKEACEAQWLKPVPPSLSDVMYGLLCDGRCAEGTFEDFCDECGYDTDSRKALEIYLACQTTRNVLIKMFGLKLFEELSQLEH